MSLVHLHVIHVALPVLQEARVVGRQHPLIVMRPHHGANTRVVGLKMEQQILLCNDL